jgi:hypothetical protein
MAEDRVGDAGAWKRAFDGVEAVTKTIGVVVAVVAILSFLLPPVGTWINVLTAWRFGAVGYVYYEVGKPAEATDGDRLTADGQLWLLAAGGDTYEDLSLGDRLQAASPVRFRTEPTKASRVVFLLNPSDCAIVIGKVGPHPVEVAESGGWLRVATTACGLFR